MTKLEKDALISKISEKLADNEDLAIELMEDVSDSFVDDGREEIDKLKNDLNSKTKEFEDLKKEYKARFLTGNNKPPKEEPSNRGLEERVVYDLKEI